MTWRERQQFYPANDRDRLTLTPDASYARASYKGASFWVDAYTYDGGRRQSVQRFPGDQYTNVQDLGFEAGRFTVNAFLAGENYDEERAALESKLLEGGPGELRIPWRDPVTVTIVDRIRVDESKGSRGYCVISFDCIVTAIPPRIVVADVAQAAKESADNSKRVMKDEFLKKFDVANQPESRRNSIRQTMNSATSKIVGAQQRVSAFVSEIPKQANQLSQLTGAVNDLINTPNDLNDEIVNAVITAYSSLRSTSTTVESVINTWGSGGPVRVLADSVFGFSEDYNTPTVDTTSVAGEREQENLDAWHLLVRVNLFAEFASLITRLAFDSYQQAIALLGEYIEAIDPVMLVVEGSLSEALRQQNQAVGAFLETIAETLPRLATFTPAQTMPALVVAHTVYGDAEREADVVIRNSIRHPGFIPSGEPLEIVDA